MPRLPKLAVLAATVALACPPQAALADAQLFASAGVAQDLARATALDQPIWRRLFGAPAAPGTAASSNVRMMGRR